MKINLKKIRESKWYKQKTNSAPYFILGPIYGAMKLLNAGERCIFNLSGTSTELYFDEGLINELAKKVVKRQQKDTFYTFHLHNHWLKLASQTEQIIDKILAQPLKTLSEAQLLTLHKKLTKINLRIWQMPFFLDIFDSNTGIFIKENLKNYKSQPSAEELQTLTLPPELLEIQKFERDLLKIAAAQVEKNNPYSIKSVIANYYSIYYGYAGGQKLTEKKLFKEISLLKKSKNKHRLEKFKDYDKTTKKTKSRLIKKYHLNKQTQNLLNMFSEITLWRDQRKVTLQKTVFAMEILGKEIAKKNKLPWNKFKLCPPYSIQTSLARQNILQKYQKLTQNSVIIMWNSQKNHLVFVKGQMKKKILKILNTAEKNFNKLKGKIAHRGLARGTIKIVNGINDFKKFKKGNILVVSMTRPEFMPILKKAKAIITNEGGITSHAAIVSRELGIPCIIGTKIATEIFKDGDKVEVDANYGFVKKIS